MGRGNCALRWGLIGNSTRPICWENECGWSTVNEYPGGKLPLAHGLVLTTLRSGSTNHGGFGLLATLTLAGSRDSAFGFGLWSLVLGLWPWAFGLGPLYLEL